jgi:hypothetical protein
MSYILEIDILEIFAPIESKRDRRYRDGGYYHTHEPQENERIERFTIPDQEFRLWSFLQLVDKKPETAREKSTDYQIKNIYVKKNGEPAKEIFRKDLDLIMEALDIPDIPK